MDYKAWSRCEAVPLSNGIVARRTGLHYLKSPEEISAYYLQNFGTFWFNELPKTDNTYNPTSQYYGCTLAPGIPLIPNLCRRPLRSPDHGYEYNLTSKHSPWTPTITETVTNSRNSWVEKNNYNMNNSHDNGNGTSTNHHLGLTRLTRRQVDFQDSGLESDSELEVEDSEELPYVRSQNTVTLLSWLVTIVTTVVTSVVTVVTETVYGRGDRHDHNHVNTRVPLKQTGGVSWYQYPVLWLYKLALLVHQADVWLLYKVNSLLRLDSWGTPQQRRKWALILLLIPLVIWAGYKLLEWWSEDDTSSVSLLSSLSSIWYVVTSWLLDLWAWFDGSWLWAPWTSVAAWLQTSEDPITEDQPVDYSTEAGIEVDWNAALTWPFTTASSIFSSAGDYLGTAASYLGDTVVVVFSAAGSFLSTVVAWVVDCLLAVPALLSSVLAFLAYPFKSMKWDYTAPVDYTVPVPSAPYSTGSPEPDASLDRLLGDRQALAGLVRHLLASEEFARALDQRQVESSLHKIQLEFSKVREELSDRISTEESSVETKMDSLKQQIQELQMALLAHKTLVSEQAALGNRLEARVTSAEQLHTREGEEQAKLKEQILLEVAKVRDEITEQFMNIQSNQKLATDSGTPPLLPNRTELEAFINSTVEKLLAIYDADKIGKVDYALASSGGSVLSVRCTETFSKKNAQYYMWGYPLWSKAANDPRIALEPAINPGECWAFTGSRGYLVIELSENITVTAFTLEHLPRSLSPTGNIDTAPKEFHVLGLESEQDDTPILLGQFKYEDNGVSLQHFQALEVDYAFKIVELVIESNHGNLDYTCLYRFRVHGRPARLS
ncbi:uncharacterized protein LOC124354327 isoform X1 [Homalodisca vitripennis]|nr:uncharacterized protein LOC124354327 isoform X1 [Homalodisca vitripennis]